MSDYKTPDQVPESWLDRCTDNGYERYTDHDGKRRYKDNGEIVADMPFRPCARCGHYPNERGDDHCIQDLGRVVNACCGHGTHDGYIQFDDGRTLRGRFTVEPAPDGWECVIDVQEVIRCRDCDYVNDDPSCTHPRWRAGQTGLIVYPPVNPDGFCAWAERDA